MDPVLRPATPGDKAAVAAFTGDTFAWGDYIERLWDEWLTDPEAVTVVAEVAGEAVACARGTLLSPTEAWAQGLRVHPAHRRHRLGFTLLEHLVAWAAASGARVIRLSSEDWNEPARALFAATSFRRAGAWLAAERPMTKPGHRGKGNGGRRTRPAEPLKPAPHHEAEPAMLSWAGGPLEQAAHGLFPIRWSWRRLTVDDLSAAARRGELWQNRHGWAMAELDEESLFTSWVCTYPDEVDSLMRALVGLAAEMKAPALEVMAPAVDWLATALEKQGCQLHPVSVYARAL